MFVLYFACWIILNGRITPEILLFGVVTAGAAAYLTARLRGRTWLEEKQLLYCLPLLVCYMGILTVEVVKAALAVIRMAWSRHTRPDPVIVEFHSGLPGSWRNVLLANSITLTPGTCTIFQEGDHLVVHSLRPEWAENLEESVFVRMLRTVHDVKA